MYAKIKMNQDNLAQKRSDLQRARIYAEAALRDFRRYEGRAADKEAKAQKIIDEIDKELAKLS